VAGVVEDLQPTARYLPMGGRSIVARGEFAGRESGVRGQQGRAAGREELWPRE
jgi:hypothetical protein